MVNSSQRLESEQFKLLSQRVSENVEELISTVTQYIEDTIFVDISPALHADLYASVHANISNLSLIHISEPTRREWLSRMPSSA